MNLDQYVSTTEKIGEWEITYQPTWSATRCTACNAPAVASLWRRSDPNKGIASSSVNACRACIEKARAHEMEKPTYLRKGTPSGHGVGWEG
tara:strand:+ start:840 stop:1112 length:273 start_codon:yes stop_codon:yes gene_type:complete